MKIIFFCGGIMKKENFPFLETFVSRSKIWYQGNPQALLSSNIYFVSHCYGLFANCGPKRRPWCDLSHNRGCVTFRVLLKYVITIAITSFITLLSFDDNYIVNNVHCVVLIHQLWWWPWHNRNACSLYINYSTPRCSRKWTTQIFS